MKYTIRTIINKPLEDVIALYGDTANYEKWMPGIVSHQIISGKQSEVGTKSQFKFKMNGRSFDIYGTILKKELTETLAQFDSNGTINIQLTKFSLSKDDKTEYVVNESFKLKGFMKVIGFLMPRSFKKQTYNFVDAFKKFAENQ